MALEGYPRVMIGLAVGDTIGAAVTQRSRRTVRASGGDLGAPVEGSGELTEVTQLALCLLEAHPADAGLELRALDACHEWLEAGPPAVGSLTRAALETGAVEAWRAAKAQIPADGALSRAPASVAAGRCGANLLGEAVTLGAVTHADPLSVVSCATVCLALRRLVAGAGYDGAWREAEATVCAADIAALVASLGPGYADDVRERLAGARAELRGSVGEGLRGARARDDGSVVSTLQTAIAAGRAASWADGVLSVVRAGDHDAAGVAALTGAILGARGLLPPSEWSRRLRCSVRWSAWPAQADGAAALGRIERACRRAAGVIEPRAYPDHVPPFVVRRLHPQVLYGRNPVFEREAVALADAGVTHVIDLREPWEWQGPDRLGAEAVAWLDRQIDRLHLPTPDGGAPTLATLDAAVAHLEAAMAAGGVAFVHCRAGQERSGAALLAWLIARGGDVDALQGLAPTLRPLPNQQAAVYRWLRARY